MVSKWCSICQDIVTAGMVNYCCWCGKDLHNQESLPEFKTYDERVKLIQKLKHQDFTQEQTISKNGQIKLF